MANKRGLPTLIRLHQRQLDEKRRVLAELEQMRAEMDHKILLLDAEIERERKAAGEGPEALRQFTRYLAGARQRRQTMLRTIDELVPRIEAAANAVAIAFQDVKRYEIAVDLKARQRRAAADREEQGELDEIALVQHRRRPT
ncbi:flagellar FliJ family protein [Zavarzinia compransoris]|uniref:flagellar FliJ family protein n=1 Tax=Zavarzinia marina TaxID=2911065 RepID=UPI001F2C7AF4|nr:flagellar FliJ family protein [Zavarzinia marina]MCF4165900.1 flagellar FliJ family protein [Zavarzinia marina]